MMTDALVNFDCFMNTEERESIDLYEFNLPENEIGPIRVYAQKVFIMAGMPIFLGVAAYVIWWIICRIKQ